MADRELDSDMKVGLFLNCVVSADGRAGHQGDGTMVDELHYVTPEMLQRIASAAETHGFTSLWSGEHVLLFDEPEKNYPYSESGSFGLAGEIGFPDLFTTLSFLAASTSRIRLGSAVCLLPMRNPVVTAKEVAALDWLSKGRFDFGIGLGWQREEYEALGVPFDRRGARADEYVRMMRSLWCDSVSQFDGELWSLPPSRMFPKPAQKPHPPIHIGGESDAALRRAVRLSANWIPNMSSATNLASGRPLAAARQNLARLLEEAGRSIDDVEVSVFLGNLDMEVTETLGRSGVNQAITFLPENISTENIDDKIGELALKLGLSS
jgi:probable F420-dependent oxidoreductase